MQEIFNIFSNQDKKLIRKALKSTKRNKPRSNYTMQTGTFSCSAPQQDSLRAMLKQEYCSGD